jgi:hypothetical protein
VIKQWPKGDWKRTYWFGIFKEEEINADAILQKSQFQAPLEKFAEEMSFVQVEFVKMGHFLDIFNESVGEREAEKNDEEVHSGSPSNPERSVSLQDANEKAEEVIKLGKNVAEGTGVLIEVVKKIKDLLSIIFPK